MRSKKIPRYRKISKRKYKYKYKRKSKLRGGSDVELIWIQQSVLLDKLDKLDLLGCANYKRIYIKKLCVSRGGQNIIFKVQSGTDVYALSVSLKEDPSVALGNENHWNLQQEIDKNIHENNMYIMHIYGYGIVESDAVESDKVKTKVVSKLSKLQWYGAKMTLNDYNKSNFSLNELLTGGDLLDLINKKKLIDKHKLEILNQIATALDFIHINNDLIHYDIKPENIMLTEKYDKTNINIRVIDFGLSTKVDKKGGGGTPKYKAPEIYDSRINNTVKVDVFSFGILMTDIYDNLDIYDPRYYEGNYALWHKYLNELKYNTNYIYNLIIQCVKTDPTSRPTMDQIKKILKIQPKNNTIFIIIGYINTNDPKSSSRDLMNALIKDYELDKTILSNELLYTPNNVVLFKEILEVILSNLNPGFNIKTKINKYINDMNLYKQIKDDTSIFKSFICHDDYNEHHIIGCSKNISELCKFDHDIMECIPKNNMSDEILEEKKKYYTSNFIPLIEKLIADIHSINHDIIFESDNANNVLAKIIHAKKYDAIDILISDISEAASIVNMKDIEDNLNEIIKN
jgi:serine/threonine protein kinase